jgi:hypothetical protein
MLPTPSTIAGRLQALELLGCAFDIDVRVLGLCMIKIRLPLVRSDIGAGECIPSGMTQRVRMDEVSVDSRTLCRRPDLRRKRSRRHRATALALEHVLASMGGEVGLKRSPILRGQRLIAAQAALRPAIVDHSRFQVDVCSPQRHKLECPQGHGGGPARSSSASRTPLRFDFAALMIAATR